MGSREAARQGGSADDGVEVHRSTSSIRRREGRATSLGDALGQAVAGLTVVPNSTVRMDVAKADALASLTTDTLIEAGVPRRYWNHSFENFEAVAGARAALEAAKRVAEDPSGLLLIGDPGGGKTHLAVAILRRRVEKWLEEWPTETKTRPTVLYTHAGERVEDTNQMILVTRPPFRASFVVVPDLLDAIRARITTPGPDPLEPLLTVPLLVLDDLGREKATEWVLDRLYVLINHRYNDMSPTVCTTNFSLETLRTRGYGPMVSRLVEDSVAVKLTAPDHRLEFAR